MSRESSEGRSLFSAYCRSLKSGCWGLWKEGQVVAVSRRKVLSQQGAHLLFYLQCQQESQGATHRATQGQSVRSKSGGLSTSV